MVRGKIMNWYILILGAIMCGSAGVVDQNPSLGRFMAVIALQSFGIVLLGYGLNQVSL